ncbi:MAG: DUF2500 family protein [Erysipelotrichia bacterium]|nr:DUF2500 family protein [Erysipelotrichia bacterium]
MRRILILCDAFGPPSYTPRIRFLCQYLADNGWDVTLCTEKIQVKAKIIKTSESISSHTTNQTITPSAYLVNGSIPQSIHSNSITTQNHQYTVTFQLANGKRLAFNVSKRKFDKLLEGDIGILTYKRRWVIDFTPIVKHF